MSVDAEDRTCAGGMTHQSYLVMRIGAIAVAGALACFASSLAAQVPRDFRGPALPFPAASGRTNASERIPPGYSTNLSETTGFSNLVTALEGFQKIYRGTDSPAQRCARTIHLLVNELQQITVRAEQASAYVETIDAALWPRLEKYDGLGPLYLPADKPATGDVYVFALFRLQLRNYYNLLTHAWPTYARELNHEKGFILELGLRKQDAVYLETLLGRVHELADQYDNRANYRRPAGFKVPDYSLPRAYSTNVPIVVRLNADRRPIAPVIQAASHREASDALVGEVYGYYTNLFSFMREGVVRAINSTGREREGALEQLRLAAVDADGLAYHLRFHADRLDRLYQPLGLQHWYEKFRSATTGRGYPKLSGTQFLNHVQQLRNHAIWILRGRTGQEIPVPPVKLSGNPYGL